MARLEEQLEFAGLERQAELVATGEVSSATLVEAPLQRAEALEPLLHPFRVILAGEARAAAAEADRRLAAGERAPLLGVPVAIKDDVDLAGQTTPSDAAASTAWRRPTARSCDACARRAP